mmetsp:Transcript_21731/g.39649  ORF Transcript_21731/g.39649 Transcript_21731/m.39649 type:complete len:397 (-) Transcript_21731:39-1229(-)
MEQRKPNLRFAPVSPDTSNSLSEDWHVIRNLQQDIIKTSQRIKKLSLYDRQVNACLDTPPPNIKPRVETTVKRSEAEQNLKDAFPSYLSSVHSPVHSQELPMMPSKHAMQDDSCEEILVHQVLKGVLARLKYLPSMYAAFKQRDLSVREMLALSSRGYNSKVFLQVLQFLDQLMNDTEQTHKNRIHRAVQTTSNKSTNTTATDVASRQSVSPRFSKVVSPFRSPMASPVRTPITSPIRSPMASPMRSPMASTIASPKHNKTKSAVEEPKPSPKICLEKSYDLEDLISPISSHTENSISSGEAEDCLKLIQGNDFMMAEINAQTERIASLNKQICLTMAASKQLLNQPIGRKTPITETTGMSEADRKSSEGQKLKDLHVVFTSSAELWGGESSESFS